jgi:hypothetical protein
MDVGRNGPRDAAEGGPNYSLTTLIALGPLGEASSS